MSLKNGQRQSDVRNISFRRHKSRNESTVVNLRYFEAVLTILSHIFWKKFNEWFKNYWINWAVWVEIHNENYERYLKKWISKNDKIFMLKRRDKNLSLTPEVSIGDILELFGIKKSLPTALEWRKILEWEISPWIFFQFVIVLAYFSSSWSSWPDLCSLQ